ncbi:MAG: hypothetical protein ACHREM_11005 [Polyangiales bacterium]
MPASFEYYVLDQNVVSHPPTVAGLHERFRSVGQRIVLSTFARYEMTKGSFKGFLRSISEIAKVPQSVVVALPTHNIAMLEVERGASIDDPSDYESTRNFRDMLAMYRAGPRFTKSIESIYVYEKDRAARAYDPDQWRHFYKSAAEELRPLIQNEQNEGRALRLVLIDSFRANLTSIIEGIKPAAHAAPLLTSFPSMLAIRVMADITNSATWGAKRNDWTTDDIEQLAHDGVDVEGAVLACRGAAFVTEDTRARKLAEQVRHFVKEIWG